MNVQSDELGSQIFTVALAIGHPVRPVKQRHGLCVITVRRVLRERIVETRVDAEVPKTRMMYPMHKNGEVPRHMIALGLFRTLLA